MPRKIFVTYKYGDSDVRPMPSAGILVPTTARHYVDYLEDLLDVNDHIYKGENDNESLAGFKDETIESRLRDKIFDTSITLVLISKNMKDPAMKESDQWIPWEISYSLKEMTRGGRASGTNGMVAVVLPDRSGSYGYFVNQICPNGCLSWEQNFAFAIIGKNMFNRKHAKTSTCTNYPTHLVHTGDDHSYMYPIKWDTFVLDINRYIGWASYLSQNLDDFEITKVVE